MAETIRFGISIDERLLEKFDRLIDEKEYSNRYEAIRDLIWEGKNYMFGFQCHAAA